MRKARDIIVLVAVATMFAFSLSMIRQVVSYRSPWFGLMIMLVFLGVVAFGRPLFLLRMPGFLRNIGEWETKGAIYKTLQVPAFGTLLRRTPLRSLNPMVYLDRFSEDPAGVLAQLESAEAAHLYSALILVPYMIHAFLQGWFAAVAGLLLVQVAFNLYPIMHLRWARLRLGRLHQRMHKASTAR